MAAVAMVSVMAQGPNCRPRYTTEQIANFQIIKLPNDKLFKLIDNRQFAENVYNCYLGKTPDCSICGQQENEVMGLLPWILKDCVQNTNVCPQELRSKANNIAGRIAEKYPKEFGEIQT